MLRNSPPTDFYSKGLFNDMSQKSYHLTHNFGSDECFLMSVRQNNGHKKNFLIEKLAWKYFRSLDRSQV